MNNSDDTNQAEGLGNFFESPGKNGLKITENKAKNVLRNPGRGLDIIANIATAAASRNPEKI